LRPTFVFISPPPLLSFPPFSPFALTPGFVFLDAHSISNASGYGLMHIEYFFTSIFGVGAVKCLVGLRVLEKYLEPLELIN